MQMKMFHFYSATVLFLILHVIRGRLGDLSQSSDGNAVRIFLALDNYTKRNDVVDSVSVAVHVSGWQSKWRFDV